MILTSRLSSDGAGCDVGDLYQFPDQTGLLDEHSRWREAAALDTEVRPGVTSGSELSAVQIWRNPYWGDLKEIIFHIFLSLL